ncbi:MAG: codA 4 [Bradyrhizobium sp.]|nr:codA 4 [Bradyrhizobium sp.]
MRRDLILRGGRVLRFGAERPELMDIKIATSGRIEAIGASLPVPDTAEIRDLGGQLVVPALVDLHQHLDKSRTRALVSNPSGTLSGASKAYQALAPSITQDQIIERALQTIETCSAHGTVAIRSHTNIEPQSELRNIEAMIAVRERAADIMRIQVVAHVTSSAPSMFAESKDWLRGAVSLGVDVIGGVPAFSDRPTEFMKLLFETADRSGLPLDMHIDEHLDDTRLLFDDLVAMTRAYGMSGRVVASHCSALSALLPGEAALIIDALRDAGIGVVTLPAANLFLQGRDASRLAPRGLTRVKELLDAGVAVAAASDNIQDPFVPSGSGDLLEIARWTVLAGQLGMNDLRKAFEMVSTVPAALMGLGSDWGIREGARADLLIGDAASLEDLVAGGALQRQVMLDGRVVASTVVARHTEEHSLSVRDRA